MAKEKASIGETSSQSSSTTYSARRALLVRDCIIGLTDGLTVPFALTAGLSALGDTHLVVMGGLAELLAGSISMGLGAYLAAGTEHKHYEVEERRERRELKEGPDVQRVFEMLGRYGVPNEAAAGVVDALKTDDDMWVQVSQADMRYCKARESDTSRIGISWRDKPLTSEAV